MAKFRCAVLLCVVLLLPFLQICSESYAASLPAKNERYRNVILMIPDGTAVSHTSLARWTQNGSPLHLDAHVCGLVRTYGSDAVVTDSAPAATAMATGFKASVGSLSVTPKTAPLLQAPLARSQTQRPVATVLEAAKQRGIAVGIVATSQLQHATPAAFTSHAPSRESYEDIAEQQVALLPDVALGGGMSFLQSNLRADKDDLLLELHQRGVSVVENRAAMLDVKRMPLWGLFAPVDLPYELDRDSSVVPSLSEMTATAIRLLSSQKKGFFLMVEGSKIDWASHAGDPAGIASELLAFDKAFDVALQFAETDGNTLILVAADHGNGGLSLGSIADTTGGGDPSPGFAAKLRNVKHSAVYLAEQVAIHREKVRLILGENYALNDLTSEEERFLRKVDEAELPRRIGALLSKRLGLGWTTLGHTGEEVALYRYAPRNSNACGVRENSDIASWIAEGLGLNLADATETLFTDANAWLQKRDGLLKLENPASANPVFVLNEGKRKLSFPVNKRFATCDDRRIDASSASIRIGSTLYVSQDLLTKAWKCLRG